MGVKRGVRRFDKWSSGSGGSRDLDTVEYNSVNGQVYENGTFGPRPGWKDFATTDGTRVSAPASDDIVGFQWFRGTNNSESVIVGFADATDGTDFKYDTVALSSGAYSSGATVEVDHSYSTKFHPPEFDSFPMWNTWNDGFSLTALGPYLAVAGTSTPGTFTASGVPPSRVASVVYRDRTYAYGIESFPGRIYYSDAADYTTYQTASFFDVNGAVTGMWPVKNALLIARKDDRWMVLTGVSPEN
mgnify:FL=1